MSQSRALQTAIALLQEAGLGSFSFGTSFSLRFDREGVESGPWHIELRLDCEWWLGKRAEWERRVSELGPSDLLDSEEAVQAFDLVRLRWSAGSKVKAVELDNSELRLVFMNGTVLSATPRAPGESWEIAEPGKSVGECDHAVVGSFEETFAK